ncbi:MAG: acyltransferase [Proteobacteria bacterium]|nr:acyltransferase [Pseudomonadota bacterium]
MSKDKKNSDSRLRQIFGLSLLSNHFPTLHGIRVLAILTVLQMHITITLRMPLPGVGRLIPSSEAVGISRNLFFGMDLFFFLSGFLIGTLLLHSLTKSEESRRAGRSRRRSVIRFYLRRGFRTFPLYYVVFVLLLLFKVATGRHIPDFLGELVYLTNYGDATPSTRVMYWGWSLSVEEHFYLAVPLLMIGLLLFKKHSSRIGLLAVLWVTALIMRILVFASRTEIWDAVQMFRNVYIRTHTRYDILIAGVLLAYLQWHFKDFFKQLFRRRWVRFCAWAVVLGCLGVLTFRPGVDRSTVRIFEIFAWGTITSVMYVPFVLLLLNTDGWFQRFLSHRFFLKSATLGYGIYLVHIPIAGYVLLPFVKYAAVQWNLGATVLWWGYLTSLFIVSTFVAYVLHLLVEKPALYAREKFVP